MKIYRSTLLALLTLASAARADFITGTVVDSNGVPVAGVNIDAIRVSNGNDINLTNDGTNASGAFLTTIPADVYDLYFFPPTPPANSHVTLVLRNVVVSGTKNLGTLHLQPGWLVNGHVQTQGGAPVGQVDVQVTDRVTGFPVPLAVHKTDAFGNFNVAVPRNAIDLVLDATGVATPVLASRTMTLTPTANTNLGNLTLEPGFRVSGTVQRSSNGLPVASVDLDFNNVATGVQAFTPNDNSNSLGNFSVTVPAGTYDIEFSAPNSLQLVGKRLANQVVGANVALGIVSLDPGRVLSGTIRSFSGAIQANADVDVYLQASGASVVTAGDNSNASGFYSVIVPIDNLRVVFRPPSFTVPLGADVHPNFPVSVNTTLDGTLPACAAPNTYGTGLAGSGGFVPVLGSSGGTTRDGNTGFAYEITNGRGGSVGALLLSAFPNSAPLLGGTLLIRPGPANGIKVPVLLGGATGVAGAGSKHVPTPFPLGIAVGFDIYGQFIGRDGGAVQGWSMSQGLHFKICP